MDHPIHRELADDGTASVTVRGEIDFANADDLAQGIRDAVSAWSPATVRVDLREATFIDSTGLGALIEGYREASDAGIRFVVVNPTPGFHRVLTVTGLCDLFGLPDPAEADGTSFAPTSATGA